MKTKTIILACVCGVLAATALVAATKQWRVFGDAGIMQIIADGAGGCAFVRVDAGNTGTVVWVDTKGTVKYHRDLGKITAGCILSCTTKVLRFLTENPPYVVVEVDSKGIETEIAAPYGAMMPAELQVYQNTTADAKGLFGILYIASGRQDLLRFSNK